MNPNKLQVCNVLGLEDDQLFLSTNTFVNPMTHIRDNAWVVFRFVLVQVSLIKLFHKGQFRLDAPTSNRRRLYCINIITQRACCDCSG